MRLAPFAPQGAPEARFLKHWILFTPLETVIFFDDLESVTTTKSVEFLLLTSKINKKIIEEKTNIVLDKFPVYFAE